jgi:hypothetical protein
MFNIKQGATDMQISLPTNTDLKDLKQYVNILENYIADGRADIAVMQIDKIINCLKDMRHLSYLNANINKIIQIQEYLKCTEYKAIEHFLEREMIYENISAVSNYSNDELDTALVQAQKNEAMFNLLIEERSRRIRNRQQEIAKKDLEWEKEIEELLNEAENK